MLYNDLRLLKHAAMEEICSKFYQFQDFIDQAAIFVYVKIWKLFSVHESLCMTNEVYHICVHFLPLPASIHPNIKLVPASLNCER